MKTLKRYFSLLLIGGFLLSSCAEEPKRSDDDAAETDSTEVAVDESMDEEELSFMLPSPIQIAAIFNRAGLKFQSDLTNPVSNLDNYNTKTAKYLNFGVYSADLAYAVLNDQQQLSIDYMNTVKSLADGIGMPSVFGTGELVESFEKNIGNQDTILRILTVIKRRTDEYLEQNAEASKEAVFFSAAWVEGMYLGANSGDSEHITGRLLEQMTILDNVIVALQVQKDPSLDLNFLIDGLQDLHNSFESYESVKQLEQTNIDISDVELSDEELKDFTTRITELRQKIISL
ncbi:MAG: hypothetical protein CMP59_04340 [Flavobacteriales bacterium]|nr:hypothetical protein [Flavobacteriales bacterium]|tara:strand:+ start:951 stop:1814 length:864 start_codon:yes stop_codon:yes gene_type:complete